MWPFSKTYKVRCPDGTIKMVYRNVHDAFPLFVPGWSAKLSADVKVPAAGNGNVGAEYQTKIQGLLFGLDELNNGLMMTFRGAYVAYQTDPCAGHSFLLRKVDDILRQQENLIKLKLQINGFVALCQNNPNAEKLPLIFQAIVDRMRSTDVVVIAAKAAIGDSEKTAQGWIEESN